MCCFPNSKSRYFHTSLITESVMWKEYSYIRDTCVILKQFIPQVSFSWTPSEHKN